MCALGGSSQPQRAGFSDKQNIGGDHIGGRNSGEYVTSTNKHIEEPQEEKEIHVLT